MAGMHTEQVLAQPAALWCRRGDPPAMQSMHRHDDLELNVVLSGELHYLFGGRRLVVRAGETAVFWAAQPHGLVESLPGDVCWVHVPFADVIGWSLPADELGPLLGRLPHVVADPGLGARAVTMVDDWLAEIGPAHDAPIRTPDPTPQLQIALLEVQALARRALRGSSVVARAARRAGEQSHRNAEGPGSPERIAQAATMARHVAEHFRSPLTVSQVAASVPLAASHAMTVFRRTVGVTIGDYITMCRVAEAQRLLLTTSKGSSEIAAAAGFGSLSSYHAHVTAACGTTPTQFRRQGGGHG